MADFVRPISSCTSNWGLVPTSFSSYPSIHKMNPSLQICSQAWWWGRVLISMLRYEIFYGHVDHSQFSRILYVHLFPDRISNKDHKTQLDHIYDLSLHLLRSPCNNRSPLLRHNHQVHKICSLCFRFCDHEQTKSRWSF